MSMEKGLENLEMVSSFVRMLVHQYESTLPVGDSRISLGMLSWLIAFTDVFSFSERYACTVGRHTCRFQFDPCI